MKKENIFASVVADTSDSPEAKAVASFLSIMIGPGPVLGPGSFVSIVDSDIRGEGLNT